MFSERISSASVPWVTTFKGLPLTICIPNCQYFTFSNSQKDTHKSTPCFHLQCCAFISRAVTYMESPRDHTPLGAEPKTIPEQAPAPRPAEAFLLVLQSSYRNKKVTLITMLFKHSQSRCVETGRVPGRAGTVPVDSEMRAIIVPLLAIS